MVHRRPIPLTSNKMIPTKTRESAPRANVRGRDIHTDRRTLFVCLEVIMSLCSRSQFARRLGWAPCKTDESQHTARRAPGELVRAPFNVQYTAYVTLGRSCVIFRTLAFKNRSTLGVSLRALHQYSFTCPCQRMGRRRKKLRCRDQHWIRLTQTSATYISHLASNAS